MRAALLSLLLLLALASPSASAGHANDAGRGRMRRRHVTFGGGVPAGIGDAYSLVEEALRR